MPSAIARLLQRAGLLKGGPESAEAEPVPQIEPEPLQEPDDDGMEEIEPDSAPQFLLSQLVAERRAHAAAQGNLAEAAGLKAPLEDVFAVSGVAPLAGGWSPDRVWDLLQGLSDADPVTRKQRLFEALVADGLTPAAIVSDALARDEALDAYEALVQRGVDETLADLDAQEASLREETERKLAALEASRHELTVELATWKEHKADLEGRWTEAVAFLVGKGDFDFTS